MMKNENVLPYLIYVARTAGAQVGNVGAAEDVPVEPIVEEPIVEEPIVEEPVAVDPVIENPRGLEIRETREGRGAF